MLSSRFLKSPKDAGSQKHASKDSWLFRFLDRYYTKCLTWAMAHRLGCDLDGPDDRLVSGAAAQVSHARLLHIGCIRALVATVASIAIPSAPSTSS